MLLRIALASLYTSLLLAKKALQTFDEICVDFLRFTVSFKSSKTHLGNCAIFILLIALASCELRSANEGCECRYQDEKNG